MPHNLPTPTRGTHLVKGRRGPLRLGVLTASTLADHAALHRTLADIPGMQLTVFCAHDPSDEEPGLRKGALLWGGDPLGWDVDGRYEHIWVRTPADFRERVRYEQMRSSSRGIIEPGRAIEEPSSDVFDAVLLHGWSARWGHDALEACEAIGAPVVVRGDAQLRDEPLPLRLMQRVVNHRAIRRLAACLSVGERSAEYFRYYGARRIVFSPHFVDNAVYAERARAARPRRQAIRSRWGISRSALAVLFVGDMDARHRPADVLKAVRGMLGVHAIFVGDGKLRGWCTQQAARFGIPATFTGALSQIAMPDALVAADVLVLPTVRDEPWGLVVNEAMASRLPAIVSEAAGCVPDLITDGITGYSYPPGDIAALRQRIARLAADPVAAEDMGVAAAARVAGYSADAAAAGVVSAVTAAIGTAD